MPTPPTKGQEPKTSDKANKGGYIGQAPGSSVHDTDPYQDGYDAGYKEGFQAGLTQKAKPNLFNACKQVVEANWQLSENELRGLIGAVEAEYGQPLILADIHLVLAYSRRRKSASHAQADAIQSLTKPRTKFETRVQRHDGDITVG